MNIGQQVQSELERNFRIYVPPGVEPPKGIPVDTERPTLDANEVFESTCAKGKGDIVDMRSEMIQEWIDWDKTIIIRGFDEGKRLRGILLGRIGANVFHIEILCSSLAGYGTMLETIAQGTALANKQTVLAVVPLPSAEPFYKKLGYGQFVKYPHMMGKHIKSGGKRKTRRARRRKLTRNKASSKV
jgi:hypothetical protein